MPTFSQEAVSRFEDVLRKDPNSQVFAPLAEAYRTEERWIEAEKIASDGVRRHPEFASGWVVLGKVQRDMKRPREAMASLRKAVGLAPENLLAMQLLGELLLELKEPKEALKVFKRVLFLNPQAEKAKRIIAKLESLTADEYDDEIFAMTKLKPLEEAASAPVAKAVVPVKPGEPSKGLMRMLSLVDAFIVRNEIGRASQLLDETRTEFGEDANIQQRQLLLQRRRASQLAAQSEEAEPLAPLASREEQIRQKKVKTLRVLLRKIDELSELR
jgi:tetratricopeptide (TPR) repeat protein